MQGDRKTKTARMVDDTHIPPRRKAKIPKGLRSRSGAISMKAFAEPTKANPRHHRIHAFPTRQWGTFFLGYVALLA